MLRSLLSSCVVAALVWSSSLQGPIAVAATESVVAIGAIETAGKAEYDLDIATEYTPAHETTSLTNSNANFKSELLALVNRERARSNLPLVCLNSKLSSAAQFHASDMATRNYFSHTGWNGSSFSQRIAQSGFSSGWRGEIIAAGQPNASAAMDSWMKSEGHRNIILGANFRFLGAGYAYNATARFRHYWVQTDKTLKLTEASLVVPGISGDVERTVLDNNTNSLQPPTGFVWYTLTIFLRSVLPEWQLARLIAQRTPKTSPSNSSSAPIASMVISRTFASTLVALSVLVAMVSASPSHLPRERFAEIATTDSPADLSQTTFAKDLLALVNDERFKAGVSPLCLNTKLSQAAQRHANDMAANSFLRNTGSDGSTALTRIRDEGFNYSSVGETIAGGQTNATGVVRAWMRSQGHQNILLSSMYSFFGAGYTFNADAKHLHYWTQDFAAGNEGEVCDPVE